MWLIYRRKIISNSWKRGKLFQSINTLKQNLKEMLPYLELRLKSKLNYTKGQNLLMLWYSADEKSIKLPLPTAWATKFIVFIVGFIQISLLASCFHKSSSKNQAMIFTFTNWLSRSYCASIWLYFTGLLLDQINPLRPLTARINLMAIWLCFYSLWFSLWWWTESFTRRITQSTFRTL